MILALTLFVAVLIATALEWTHLRLAALLGASAMLLLGLVLITAPVAALLPNPSAALLMAPLLPPMARELELDFRPLLILMVLAANSASLLTLAGDPALYSIGTGMRWDFLRYLQRVTPAALLVLAALLPTLPWLYPPIWRAWLPVTDLRPQPTHHRGALPWLLLVAMLMLALFIGGGSLPVPPDPAAVALGGAVATLFISQHSGLRAVDALLASID